MFCMKWENTQITRFKVYKWNERLLRNNVSKEHGIFVFRRHHDGRIIRIVRFRLRFLINPTVNLSTGDFQARPDGLTFSSVMLRSGLFWMRSADDHLVNELTAFTRALFEFSKFTVNCPWAPRLVFMVDFSYTPVMHSGCPPSSLPSVTRFEMAICTEPHDADEPGVVLSERDEENLLQFCPAFETDDEDEEVDSGDMGHVVGPGDVEATYSEEMRELVRRLRRYRNVGRTFPLLPLSYLDPLGLIEVNLPVMETLRTTMPFFDCPICHGGMKAEEVVVKTKCGHVFHRDCVIQWLSTQFTCPSCRTFSIKLL